MAKFPSNHQSRLETYLTVSLGIGCIAPSANAAIMVESFGMGSQNATLADGTSITIFGDPYIPPPNLYGGYYFIAGGIGGPLFGGISGNFAFRGGDSPSAGGINSSNNFLEYNYNLPPGTFAVGAEAGTDNFVFLDQNGNGTYETLLNFNLDGSRNGVLLAAAVESTGANINYSEAVAMLTIPEPSGISLLSLGAAGLLARRNRKTTHSN